MNIVRIGNQSQRVHAAETIGAKAANLERMAALGLPVPPAFVLPIELCAAAMRGDPAVADKVADGLEEGIAFLESATGRRFGDRRRPLLVSVRSGAARSMPGMLDTVLDVGCTADAARGLIRSFGDPRFACDCRRRFLESYGAVVLGIEASAFTTKLNDLIAAEGAPCEQALDGEALERLVAAYEDLIEQEEPCAFPRADGSAQERRRSGAPLLDERTRPHLSPAATSRRPGGHGGDGPGHGVRQLRLGLGRGRCVLARSFDRRRRAGDRRFVCVTRRGRGVRQSHAGD